MYKSLDMVCRVVFAGNIIAIAFHLVPIVIDEWRDLLRVVGHLILMGIIAQIGGFAESHWRPLRPDEGEDS
jgi:hypothetical protein